MTMPKILAEVALDEPNVFYCRLILQLETQVKAFMEATTPAGKDDARSRMRVIWNQMFQMTLTDAMYSIANFGPVAQLIVDLNDEDQRVA